MQTDGPELQLGTLPETRGGEDSHKTQTDKEQPPYTFFEGSPLKAIVYHNRSFQGSQLNLLCFVKEAAAIFKAILRMSFYLTDSHILIHSDHRPLQKFIYGLTTNERVNDSAFQIHAICRSIQFEYITGSSNTLSDSLSRLRYYDLYNEPKPEKPGFEFNKPEVDIDDESLYKPLKSTYQDEGLNVFVLTLDPVGTPDKDAQQIHVKLTKKVPLQSIINLQQKEFASIIKNVKKHGEKLSHLYIIDGDGVLRRIIRDNNTKMEVIVVPKELTRVLLFEVHETLAHPGQLKMFLFIRRAYFWKNLRTDVNAFVRNCSACNKVCLKEPNYMDFTNVIPQFPMANIVLDLLGPFLPISRGNERIVSCMDLLTHYIFLVPIPNKQTEMVIKAYTENIYLEAGGSQLILSD